MITIIASCLFKFEHHFDATKLVLTTKACFLLARHSRVLLMLDGANMSTNKRAWLFHSKFLVSRIFFKISLAAVFFGVFFKSSFSLTRSASLTTLTGSGSGTLLRVNNRDYCKALLYNSIFS